MVDNKAFSKIDIYEKRTSHNCCNCKRGFYAQVRNNYIIGRIPLILPCTHLICEECVLYMYKTKTITCNICKDDTVLNEGTVNFRSIFPIDRFILGSLVKQNISEKGPKSHMFDKTGIQNVHFQPAGSAFHSSYLGKNQHQAMKTITNQEPKSVNKSHGTSRTATTPCTEHSNCKNDAEWRCIDCDDVYCDSCNTKVHNAARAFRKHVRIPVGRLDISDFSIYCEFHRGTHPDYCCAVCDLFLCWRCMIEDHQGHSVKSIAEKNKTELPAMKDKLVEAEKLLKRLRYEQQKIRCELKGSSKNAVKPNAVELAILKHFTNLHTRLQLLQNKMMEDYIQAQNTAADTLNNIYDELIDNEKDLSTLISICNLVDNSDAYLEKLIVKELNNKLNQMLEMPCLLQGYKTDVDCIEFKTSDNFILDIEKHCSVEVLDSDSSYKLVPVSSFPNGVELLPTESELSSLKAEGKSRTSSISSDTSFCSKSNSTSSRTRLSFAESSQNNIVSNTLKIKEVKLDDNTLIKDSSETVIVTHLVNPSLFYVQLTKMNKNIENLNKKLTQYALHAATPDSPQLNHTYLAQYTNKNFKRWYRATIKNIIEKEETMYEVFYLDYGNTAVIPKTMLRELTQILMKDAPYAHQCQMHNMVSSTEEWSTEVIQYMVEFITGTEPSEDADLEYLLHSEQSSKQMQLYVIENINGILNVDLLHNDLSSLKYALMFVGWASTETEEENMHVPAPKLFTCMKKIHTTIDNFKKDQICHAIVTSIIDPHHFYIQIDENKNAVVDLTKKMEKYYTKHPKKDLIYIPEEGMVCVALFPDNTWKRAEVTNLPGHGNVEVFALDYGESYIIPWNKIRKLNNDFVTLDAQAVRVSLIDIEPVGAKDWTTEAINYFSSYTKDKILRMVIEDPAITELNIKLYEVKADVDICINALLVREKHAVSTGDSSLLVNYYKDIPIDEQSTVKYNTCNYTERRTPTMPANTRIENKLKKLTNNVVELSSIVKEPSFRKSVCLVSIESPDCFYLTLPEWLTLRNKLTKDMKQFYSTKDAPEIEWKPSDKCAVLSIKENAWYRGIILNVVNNGYIVFLKDIAFKEELPGNNIHELDEQFLVVRDLTIKCSLAGITPAGGSEKWTHIAIERFQELANLHSDLYITKQGDIVNKSLPVNLYATWEEIGGPIEPSTRKHSLLNKCLIDQGVALPAKGTIFEETIPNENYNISSNDPLKSSPTLSEEIKITEVIPRNWLPPLPLTEKRFKAIATYVDLDGCVYLHGINLEENLKQMKRALNNNFLVTSPDPEHDWFPGQMCTVQYYFDRCYYRATILNTNSKGEIVVKLIDYGSEEECTHNDIRSDVMFIDKPAMATKCKLFNVKPRTRNGKWPVPLLDKLHATIVDKEVDVEVMEHPIDNETVGVILSIDKENINNLIMNTDWLKEEQQEIKGTIIEDEDDDVLIEGSISDVSDDKIGDWVSMANLEQLNEVRYKYTKLPTNSKTFEAVIINVLDYNTLIIEGTFNMDLIQNTEDEFDKLSKDMNKDASKQPPVFEPTVGQACCTAFSEDKNWYRAEIYSVDALDKFGQVQVLFVDYGNLDIVPRESVRMLREEWADYPVNQLKCKIFGIKKADDVDTFEASKCMSEMLLDKRLLLIVKETEPLLQASFLDLESTNLAYKKGIDDGIFILDE